MPVHDASRLSTFDAWTVVIAVLAATALMGFRRFAGVDHRARQWLDDALNVGTLLVLGALVLSSFPWWPYTIPASPLTDISVIYCGGVIYLAIFRSLKKT